MGTAFDIQAIDAAFAQPSCDGSFAPDFAAYLKEIGATRPSVVLAFAPKAAGTYLRTAAIGACDGQLVRTVHAQGGRDASFYLPTWLNYFAHGVPARPLVTHVHMQALPANRLFIEALGLKPVIMLRAIDDMLASYADMVDQDSRSPDNWINMRLPVNYERMGAERQNDFLIEMVAPWYVSYFSSWAEYVAMGANVLMLEFDSFRADPATALEQILTHSGLAMPRDACQRALDAVWVDRADYRFNMGVPGRGRQRFTAAQIARLKRLVEYYPVLAPWTDKLIPPPSTALRSSGPSAAA